MIVTALLEQPSNKSDDINKVVTSCQQFFSNLLTTCSKLVDLVKFLRVYLKLLPLKQSGTTYMQEFAGNTERDILCNYSLLNVKIIQMLHCYFSDWCVEDI